MVSLKRRMLLYAHAAKCGGTTIEEMLSFYTVKDDIKFTGLHERKHATIKEGMTELQLRDIDAGEWTRNLWTRNPFDIVASNWMMSVRITRESWSMPKPSWSVFIGSLTLEEYVGHLLENPLARPGAYSLMAIHNGTDLCNFVSRFETFQQSLDELYEHVGLPRRIAHHLNRGDGKGYADLYNANTVRGVKKLYEYELDRFKYTFEETR